MRYSAFGQTGLQVGALGLGCMMFGWRTSQVEADRIVSLARDSGVNFFDTSVSYGRGASEIMLGLALTEYSRDSVVIATKCGLPSEDDAGVNASGASRYNIIRQCEISLKRLNTDYIDLLQLHRWFKDVPIDETLWAFDRLVRDGKIRYFGTSNFQSWQVVEGLWKSDMKGLLKPVSEQFRYNMLDRSAELALLPVLEHHGLGSIIYSPLAEGLLTGRYSSRAPFEEDSRFAQSRDHQRYADQLVPAVDQALSLLSVEAARLGRSIAALATAWIFKRQGISVVLAGVSRAEQFSDVVGAEYIQLEPAIISAIDEICPPGSSIIPKVI